MSSVFIIIKSPYTFPGGVAKIVLHNAARVAEVWLDEWKEFYYAMSPGYFLKHFFSFYILFINRLSFDDKRTESIIFNLYLHIWLTRLQF